MKSTCLKTSFVILLLNSIFLANCGKKPEIIKAKYISADEYQHLLDSQPSLGDSNSTVDSSYNYFFTLGMTMFQNEKYDSANAAFIKALTFNNTEPQVYYYLGLIASIFQEYTQAEEYLYTSLKFSANVKKARSIIYLALGANYEQQGQYGRAKQNFITALNLDQASLQAREGLRRLESISRLEK